MSKFKVGDKVKVARKSDRNCGFWIPELDAVIGQTGIVSDPESRKGDPFLPVKVKLTSGNEWNFPENALNLLEEPTAPAPVLSKSQQNIAKLLEKGIIQAFAAGKSVYIRNDNNQWVSDDSPAFNSDADRYSLEIPIPKFHVGSYIVKVDKTEVSIGCLRIPRFSTNTVLKALECLSDQFKIHLNELPDFSLSMKNGLVELTTPILKTYTANKTIIVELCEWLKTYHGW